MTHAPHPADFDGTGMTVLIKTDTMVQWAAALAAQLPGLAIRLWPEVGAPEDLDAVILWKPPPGLIATLPRLRAIFSTGAGIDHLTSDPTLPAHLPLVRLIDPQMAVTMTEYVMAQVLRLHRLEPAYLQQQRDGAWIRHEQPYAFERTVGILGMGTLGQHAAAALAGVGFEIVGWSRQGKDIGGVRMFHGDGQLGDFLRQSQILVCLLPLTQATENILDADRLARLPPGAAIVNAARGGLIVDADLVAALDRGHLSAAVLDVFREEPLPAGHPFWSHPRILVTPHVAASTDPRTAGRIIAAQLGRLHRGETLLDRVDRRIGY